MLESWAKAGVKMALIRSNEVEFLVPQNGTSC